MSKGELLRDLVNARLTAAVEDVFLLFNKTIAEYEEELSRSKEETQRKQLLLDSILSPRIPLVRVNSPCFNGPRLTQENIKNEHEEQSIKREEEVPCIESTITNVKTEECAPPQQRQAEHKEDSTHASPCEIQVENCFHIGNVEDWLHSLNSAENVETVADGVHRKQVQVRRNNSASQTRVFERNDVSKGINGGDDRMEKQREKKSSAKGDKKHQCPVCSRRYNHKRNLLAHMRDHDKEESLSCSVCMKTFTRKSSVLVHMRTHSGEKLFSCTFCKKNFSRKTTLRLHQRVHTKEKPYSCAICNMKFSQTGNLQMHERTHTGEKPFSCTICKKSFSRNTHLTRHKISHTGEKPFSCSVCEKSFTTKFSLNNHIVKHLHIS